MLATLLALASLATPLPVESTPRPADAAVRPLAPDAQVHLFLGLGLRDRAGLEALLVDQQSPASPAFRRWLTPARFGARFGAPEPAYAQLAQDLAHAGLEVERFPGKLAVAATGRAAQLEKVLGVRFVEVTAGGETWRSFVGAPRLPFDARWPVVTVSGLDTRVLARPRLTSGNGTSLGPQDVRRIYQIDSLQKLGFTGEGSKVVALGAQPTAAADINEADVRWFYANVSDAKAQLVRDTLPNPGNDFYPGNGVRSELELDTEMSSIAAPGASEIVLLEVPASELFSTGLNALANRHPDAAAASVSFGSCEANITAGAARYAETLVQQLAAEGVGFFAASGDNGADDCQSGVTSVDFPASIPLVTAVGGTQLDPLVPDGLGNFLLNRGEIAWNLGAQGGAGGGGISTRFLAPSWQLGLQPEDHRALPDIALVSSPEPGVATCTRQPGTVDAVSGTSDAAPMAAGIFALLNQVIGGCRVGAPNLLLWQLGHEQALGGLAVFHDVTQGDLTFNGAVGPSAGPGYDAATGWGSLDVAALANRIPSCAAQAYLDGGSSAPPVVSPRAPYDPCAFIDCQAPQVCKTAPNGPSACVQVCDPAASNTCPHGDVCKPSRYGGSACAPGCEVDADCTAPQVCGVCQGRCVNVGNADAGIGDACRNTAGCATGGQCFSGRFGFPGDYCSQPCSQAPGACSCPSGSICAGDADFSLCYLQCDPVAQTGCRTGYVCSTFDATGRGLCTPPCTSDQDCRVACDVDAGLCIRADAGAPDAGPTERVDAGPARDAGPTVDAGPTADAGAAVNPVKSSGCGCQSGDFDLAWLGVGLLALRRRGRG
jgi:kumamolisin